MAPDRNGLGYPEGAWRELGLKDGEYERIVELLGRAPNWTELGMFSALWSEHCAYKHSRSLFHLLPTRGERILQGVGENAGVVDIGDGLAVTFKVESHNHPSAVEPYQGAATGVGGILRDVFAMGARPIAVLNSLRFGPLSSERARYLLGGVVSGIAGYGNAVGVPTVGGEVGFDETYEGNPLVNVMAVGLVRHGDVATASAKGIGNPVMVVGARTGRDGIHGAAFASAELDEEAEAKRPSVQVGDPFTGKLLIEACLELIGAGVVVGIQDMGAAGLTSSAAEMAARAGSGIEIDVLKVPRREEGMTPFEVMLSESQERMLVVPRQGAEEQVAAICAKWGLEAAVIGRVTDDGMLRVYEGDCVVAEVPAKALSTEGAPSYHPEERVPAYLEELRRAALPAEPRGDLGESLLRLLADPNIANKAWVYRQYDFMVQTRTAVEPGAADAAVLRLRESGKGLALSIDCNALHCYVDPYTGAAAAVAEAARNLVCTGARPLALTDGLNFGSPERPEIYWQLHRAVEGIAAAARALGTPVVGGNVSLYNETGGRAIYPTPIIGMVGVLDDVAGRLEQAFRRAGDAVYLVGPAGDALGGSRYLKALYGVVKGPLPPLDLELERRVQEAVLACAGERLLTAAHDCSEGGLAVALAEMCISGQTGAAVTLQAGSGQRADGLLFGEGYSRVLVAVAPERRSEFENLVRGAGVPFLHLGEVGGDRLAIDVVAGGRRVAWIDEPVDLLARAWYGAIPQAMEGAAGAERFVESELGRAR